MMTRYLYIVLLFIIGCGPESQKTKTTEEIKSWEIGVLPPSIRIDPVSSQIIDYRFDLNKKEITDHSELLHTNWIYDGENVKLHGARGEYVSLQLVINNATDSLLKGIKVQMTPFETTNGTLKIEPELFLEWSVEVETPSTGYPKATLGKGWYPDALIPIQCIQSDSAKVTRRWVYPFTLPDFNNRIINQKSQIIWVDQFIPQELEDAPPGEYSSSLEVTIGGKTQSIKLNLSVWDFEIPNENKLRASLQQEGFLSRMEEDEELSIYQLFKRNRVSLMDPTYKPGLKVSKNGKYELNWDDFDHRLKKYLTGAAFTKEYGYNSGPGYGEPLETFALPFDVYGKHGTLGWPDVGKPDVERLPSNRQVYTNIVQQIRGHLQSMVDPKKTELLVYLNGLDESYFPEAWDRMVYYGDLFKKEYPEAQFRVDGAYSDEAMEIIGESIDAWASHTINYNIDKVKEYQDLGIHDWIYGPMLYESEVNSWVGSSTFIDLPLVNDRAISWSVWKYRAHSWISWGIGAGWERGWYDPESWKDFFKENAEADAQFTYRKFNGNGSLIYKPGIVPNVSVPCPSIRLKTMRNGVQEYEYMRLLTQLDGNPKRTDSIVNKIINKPFGENAIGKFDIWSYDAAQWDKSRIALGNLINETIKGSRE